MGITLEMTYGGKGVRAILPDSFSVEQKRRAFDICREALLRDEREALLRAALAEQGFQYEVIRERSEAAKLIVRPEDILA